MKEYKLSSRLCYVLLFAFFAFPFMGAAQNFMQFDEVNQNILSAKALQHYNHYASKPSVDHIELIRVDVNKIQDGRIGFVLENGNPHEVRMEEINERENGIKSFFGEMEDESGIYFTIKNEQMISKFYDGENAITILPLEGNIHMLLRFNEDIEPAECGAPDSPDEVHQHGDEIHSRSDNGCKVRVQICFTDDAVAVVPGDLHLFAYSAIDEANLAFQRSNTVIRYEIATVRWFNAVENLNRVNNRVVELQQFFDNDAPYNNVNIYRGNYRADLNILIVSQNMDGGSLFGQVIAVGTNDDNAYAIASVPSITVGRFTFTHELGHIMGARHENHGSSYNRGMVIENSGTNRQRTIMARTGASFCNLTTSCRVQNFSNPGITVGGNATGVNNQFDNARWLDENANTIRNYRENWNNVTINPETIGSNVMGNYSANTSISTNGNVVCNNNGELNFRAGSRIDLNNGFQINNGGSFAAILGNCNANFPREAAEGEGETLVEVETETWEEEKMLSVNPNPVKDVANINFNLIEDGFVQLSLSDANGMLISNILNQQMKAGSHSIQFENKSMTPGMYYITLQSNDYLETVKLVVVK